MSFAEQRRILELAGDSSVHRAFSWLHLHELQLRRWQLEFLAIAAPPFAERGRAEWFCQRFRDLGLANPHIDEEGNALATLPGDWDLQDGFVLLSAHLDTVFPIGTDCEPREQGRIIHCPGACDNGAGLAALLGLAAALQHARITPRTPVVFAANVGEEGEGDLRGMRHLFSSARGRLPDAAIALEGAGNGLVVDRALGSRRLRVTLSGPGGHSWADSARPNPILLLSAALLAIARLPLPRQPRTTLNVGRIEGGTSVNSIPARASAEIDLRSTSEMELDRLEIAVLSRISAECEADMRDRADPDRLHLAIERTGQRAVGALPSDAPILRSLRAVDRHLGLTTEPRIASTDANVPLSMGIPALAIGAGGRGGGLHTVEEWYDPTGRDLALRRVLLLLLDTCASVAAEPKDASLAAEV